MLSRRSNAKIIASFIVLCFLTVSFNQYAVSSEILNDPTPLCYGFVLPNAILENKTLENQIFCKIRHLVNDLLREEISVYWTASNITVNIGEVISNKEFEMFFEKGSFIVPFTGDDAVDSKIIAIVCDYNQSSEIEENNVGAPVYLLMQQLDTLGRGLSNVKIANYVNFLTCGASWFADVAYKCGFLNFDFFRNMETRRKLKNSNYNLIIWPGYDCYYSSSYSFLEIILGLYLGRNRAIRKFVGNGGGFVGSCYAVHMAACGAEGLPRYPDMVLHNPNLPSIGFLSISDIIAAPGKSYPMEQQVLDIDHPVVYGVDKYLIGGFGPGPKMINVGESVNVIAELKNDTKSDNIPTIVSNNFGDGKVVLFSPHPEVSDPDTGPKFWNKNTKGSSNGKKLVTNAFYFATAHDEAEFEASESRNLSFIADVWNETRDLSAHINEQEKIFEELESDIDDSIENVVEITNQIYSILDTIEQIGIELNIDSAEIKDIFYYGGTRYLLYCFDLIKIYLENTTTTLETIEKIYPLLKDDTNFIKQLKQLKNDLSCKINKMQRILSTSSKKLDKMENLLESYRQCLTMRKNIAKTVEKTSHDIELQTDYMFQLMPGGYFNLLKFLRHHWYDYEVSILEN